MCSLRKHLASALVVVALLLLAAPASAAITEVGTRACSTTGGTVDSPTTAAINTTGATLVVVMVHVGFDTGTISDSVGNTGWTEETMVNTAGNITRSWWKASPTTNAAHTFTYNGTAAFGTICAVAFAGTATASPRDQISAGGGTAGAGVLTQQGGSVTPSEANEVVVSVAGLGDTVTAIDGSFTPNPPTHSAAGGNGPGSGLAYLIQTSAAAANPTWTNTNADDMAVLNITFKSAGGGGGATVTPKLLLLGVGP